MGVGLGFLVVVPAASANPLGDVWVWTTDELGGIVSGAAGDGLRALTSWVADGAGWLAGRCFSAMSQTADPRPQEAWFSQAYGRMALIGVLFSAPCFVLGVIQSLLRQDTRMLGRVIAALPGVDANRLEAFLAERRLAAPDTTRLAQMLGPAQAYVSAKPQRIAAVELRATLAHGQTNNIAGARAVIAVLPQDSEPYRVLMFTPMRTVALR